MTGRFVSGWVIVDLPSKLRIAAKAGNIHRVVIVRRQVLVKIKVTEE
jgi:hypothetical protein